jgi:glutamate/tyrosine decarboxylase-like PLP-dependent enzyme
VSNEYPYAERFGVNRVLPEKGRPRAEVLAELREMAHLEDRSWESGRCSGTMYCGDHDHYDFMNEAFGLFSHVNALQRDICPSSTRFEGEIIAMALDLMHADAVEGTTPAGLVTTGGTGSWRHPTQSHQARNSSPRLRQGLPPVRRGAAAGARRPADDAGGSRLDCRSHR